MSSLQRLFAERGIFRLSVEVVEAVVAAPRQALLVAVAVVALAVLVVMVVLRFWFMARRHGRVRFRLQVALAVLVVALGPVELGRSQAPQGRPEQLVFQEWHLPSFSLNDAPQPHRP
jgi:hypothetical protein